MYGHSPHKQQRLCLSDVLWSFVRVPGRTCRPITNRSAEPAVRQWRRPASTCTAASMYTVGAQVKGCRYMSIEHTGFRFYHTDQWGKPFPPLRQHHLWPRTELHNLCVPPSCKSRLSLFQRQCRQKLNYGRPEHFGWMDLVDIELYWNFKTAGGLEPKTDASDTASSTTSTVRLCVKTSVS